MRHIRTVSDLDRLKESKLLPEMYFLAVETYFDELKEGFDFDGHGCDFALESGHIVIVEPNDSGEELERLLSSWPEYAELVYLDGSIILKVVVVEDNDFIMTYFTERGVHPQVDAWADPYLDDGITPDSEGGSIE